MGSWMKESGQACVCGTLVVMMGVMVLVQAAGI